MLLALTEARSPTESAQRTGGGNAVNYSGLGGLIPQKTTTK